MKYIEVQELKMIQIDMLKSIDRFCSLHNLKYSLAFGSLLGAVRHKGYIPWDDDLDIMLPREDYEKFINGYSDETYSVISLSNNNTYELPFAKVYNCRTVMDEFARTKTLYGVYIDVFPVDNAPDNELELNSFLRQKSFWNVLHNLKIVRVNKDRSILKNTILALSHVLLSPINLRTISERMNRLSAKYVHENTLLKGIIVPADNHRKEIINAKYYQEYTHLPFEGFDAMVIKNFDEYLSGAYGDYMQLPPIEKRVSHHAFKAWWKD